MKKNKNSQPQTKFTGSYIKKRVYIDWPNFITRLCLLLKLFNKMFRVHAWAFDDAITFEYLLVCSSLELKNIIAKMLRTQALRSFTV